MVTNTGSNGPAEKEVLPPTRVASECLHTEWRNVGYSFQRFADAVARQTGTSISATLTMEIEVSEIAPPTPTEEGK